MISKLAEEARNRPQSWNQRGVRVLVMYPMNALVSDQISRLRNIIGDSDGEFMKIFRRTCPESHRRPQFGMYTGRTPYPGLRTNNEDVKLAGTLAEMVPHEIEEDDKDNEKVAKEEKAAYLDMLKKQGKIPAKKDLRAFADQIRMHQHEPDPDDAELITRFEMQKYCPDILITNYSMLEYMLMRPRERKIWDDTKRWLEISPDNRLLFIIDEAHMYKGAAGGEVALEIRRVFHRLGISRERVQFILTTASMPNSCPEDEAAVMKFATDLTAAEDHGESFCFITGSRENIDGRSQYDIPFEKIKCEDPGAFENTKRQKEALDHFWSGVENAPAPFRNMAEAADWMFAHLIDYKPFQQLMLLCRGEAVSLDELASHIFYGESKTDALQAVSVLLAIAPLAKNQKGMVLFPARMHMLFRGIRGIFACTNPECSDARTDGKITLGKIFLSDGILSCPTCGSTVYELMNDRRCGALYFTGFINKEDFDNRERTYLWRYVGQNIEYTMCRMDFYIPSSDFVPDNPKNSKYPVKPCYLDVNSGYIDFQDDSLSGKPGIRTLYYSEYEDPQRQSAKSFYTCPHCRQSRLSLTPFSTRGNQPFYNLIHTQFELEPPVKGKDKDLDRLPNQGRKVLLFSDSRQRAATLARDMSDAADVDALRQLLILAVDRMQKLCQLGDQSLNRLYGYLCLCTAEQHLNLFYGNDQIKFLEQCREVYRKWKRSEKHNRVTPPIKYLTDAPGSMQKYV
ncbi:MAG: hypothetical protein PUF78_10675, partial [Lachnospiraceae bacterium]|nr:hypothetical protein [Lachnospiraceae bacterium]